MLRNLLILNFLLAVSFGRTADWSFPGGDILCEGCQLAVGVVESKLKTIENITRKDLTDFANGVCAQLPKLEIFDTLCTKVKDDLVDIAVQIIESLERQFSGNVTCKALQFC